MTATFHIHHIHSDLSLINHPIIRHYTIYAAERRVVMAQAVAHYTDFITAFFAFRLLLGSTVHIFNVRLKKARPSLSRFSRNSEMPNRIMCEFFIPTFTQKGR